MKKRKSFIYYNNKLEKNLNKDFFREKIQSFLFEKNNDIYDFFDYIFNEFENSDLLLDLTKSGESEFLGDFKSDINPQRKIKILKIKIPSNFEGAYFENIDEFLSNFINTFFAKVENFIQKNQNNNNLKLKEFFSNPKIKNFFSNIENLKKIFLNVVQGTVARQDFSILIINDLDSFVNSLKLEINNLLKKQNQQQKEEIITKIKKEEIEKELISIKEKFFSFFYEKLKEFSSFSGTSNEAKIFVSLFQETINEFKAKYKYLLIFYDKIPQMIELRVNTNNNTINFNCGRGLINANLTSISPTNKEKNFSVKNNYNAACQMLSS